jgi:hypothetical protein
VEWRAEIDGVAGVADRGAVGRDLPEIAVNAAQMYRWKRSLDQGLKEAGALVPKSLVGGLQRRVEELERALGRKALDVDVLKKVFELKGLKLPEGIYGG